MNNAWVRAVSSLHPPRVHTLDVYAISAHFFNVSNETNLIGKMRRRILALENEPDKAELANALDEPMRDFLIISSSHHKSQLVAMDAIRLIKLCRMSLQPSRIADIWPRVVKISLLPAKEDKVSSILIGSVVSAVLEAKDTATAASVWEFVRSSPRLPLQDAHVIQLLGALRGRPDLVVELVTDLLQGSLRVCAQVKHLNAALQALANAPKEAKGVFELANENKMVSLSPQISLLDWFAGGRSDTGCVVPGVETEQGP